MGSGRCRSARAGRGPKTGLLILGQPISHVDQPAADATSNGAARGKLSLGQRTGPARLGIEAKRFVVHEVIHNLSPFWLHNKNLHVELVASLAT